MASPVAVTFQVRLGSSLPDGTAILNRSTISDSVDPSFDKMQSTVVEVEESKIYLPRVEELPVAVEGTEQRCGTDRRA